MIIIISRPSSTGKNTVYGDMDGNIKIDHDSKQAMISHFYVGLLLYHEYISVSLYIPVTS